MGVRTCHVTSGHVCVCLGLITAFTFGISDAKNETLDSPCGPRSVLVAVAHSWITRLRLHSCHGDDSCAVVLDILILECSVFTTQGM